MRARSPSVPALPASPAFRSSSGFAMLTGLPVALIGDMRWTPGGRSPNLEDRRGRGGMGGPLGIGGGLVTLILALLFGPGILEQGGEGGIAETGGEVAIADSAREEPMVQFVSFVLDDVQSTWGSIFQRS